MGEKPDTSFFFPHQDWTTGPLGQAPQESALSATAAFSSTIGASPLPPATISIPSFGSLKLPRAPPQKAVQYEHARGASLIPVVPCMRPPVTDLRPFSTEAVRTFHKNAVAAGPSDLDKAVRWQQRVAARKKRQAQAYPAEYEEVEAQQPHVDTSVVPEIPAPTQPLVGALEPRSLEEVSATFRCKMYLGMHNQSEGWRLNVQFLLELSCMPVDLIFLRPLNLVVDTFLL